jgi:hypothetical protein
MDTQVQQFSVPPAEVAADGEHSPQPQPFLRRLGCQLRTMFILQEFLTDVAFLEHRDLGAVFTFAWADSTAR